MLHSKSPRDEVHRVVFIITAENTIQDEANQIGEIEHGVEGGNFVDTSGSHAEANQIPLIQALRKKKERR